MALSIFLALALAVLVRAGLDDSITTYKGDNGGWRASPQTDSMMLEQLSGPACAEGTVARVLEPGMSVDLFFTGREILLYGVPPPDDVHVQYVLDADEKPPRPETHWGPPARDTCELLRSVPRLDDRLHKLTITVDQPRHARTGVKLFIANATVISSLASTGESSSIGVPFSISTKATETLISTAQAASTTESPSPPHQKMNKGTKAILAAAAIGGVVLFLGIGFGIYWLMRRRKARTPPSAAFRARMVRTEFIMVTGEHGRGTSAYVV